MSSKFNIYKIESKNFAKLEEKLLSLGKYIEFAKKEVLQKKQLSLFEEQKKYYDCFFYTSKQNEFKSPKWADQYNFSENILKKISSYQPFAIIILKPSYTKDFWYIITHGKGHFYINGLAIVDYGINLAARGLINKDQIKQLKIDNIFKSKNNKMVISSQNECTIDPLNGNVYSFVKSRSKSSDINTIRCGSSIQFSTDLNFLDLPSILENLENFESKNPSISMPVLLKVHNEKVENLDQKLIAEFKNVEVEEVGQVGVQIILNDNDQYRLYKPQTDLNLDTKELNKEVIKKFFTQNNLDYNNLCEIKVKISGDSNYTTNLKNLLSFQTELDGIMYLLKDGFWWYYNDTFVDSVNKYIEATIKYVEPEEKFVQIYNKKLEGGYREERFIKELEKNYGYKKLDKENIKLQDGTTIEVADLYKDNIFYVVKIGKIGSILNYSFDQAMRSTEQLKDPANKTEIKKKNIYFNKETKICLWLVLNRRHPQKLSDIESLHFKMKLCEFWIKAQEFGFTPQLQIEFTPIIKNPTTQTAKYKKLNFASKE